MPFPIIDTSLALASHEASELPCPDVPTLPRGLHRRQAWERVQRGQQALFEVWLRDDLTLMPDALAGLLEALLSMSWLYGLDVESRLAGVVRKE
jgi:hypothetical protein